MSQLVGPAVEVAISEAGAALDQGQGLRVGFDLSLEEFLETSIRGIRALGPIPFTEQQLLQVVKATGIVSPDETRVAHILPLAQGVVEKVFVQLGTRVTQGQPLLLYDNIELGGGDRVVPRMGDLYTKLSFNASQRAVISGAPPEVDAGEANSRSITEIHMERVAPPVPAAR